MTASAAYPLHFDKVRALSKDILGRARKTLSKRPLQILNTHSILKARSLGKEQPQRRAFGPAMGDVASTVFGNAIGGAVGPIFEEIGTSLSRGMSRHSHGLDDHGHDDEVIEYQTEYGPYDRKKPNETSRRKLKQNSEE
ncbi:hypothetical protein Golomagni_03894 [Golovinomyces magnicellulatus]|nr:hypothetical protein Golomagni_03894 [Golovinomyces magnicellulatus]